VPLAEVPCIATLVSFDMNDGSGVLETERGEKVRCGPTAFKPAVPEQGKRYRVLEAKDYPGIGTRAVKVEPVDVDGAAAAPKVVGPFPAELGAALDWLVGRGIGVMRAPAGATADAIGGLENRLGVTLPASCVELYRAYHWIETGPVSTLALEPDGPRRSIEEARTIVRAHVEAVRAGLPTDAAKAAADAIASWIPLAEIGNPLPQGAGIFLDTDGNLRRASVKELATAAPGPVETAGLAELVRAILAETYGA
jgi:hypothetical protein